MLNKLYLIFFSLLLLPFLVFAADNSFTEATRSISGLIKVLISIAFSLAFLAFFWGMLKYLGTNSEESKKDALKLMATSVTIIFVMVSVWGLIALLRNTFGVPSQSGSETVNFPKVVPTGSY